MTLICYPFEIDDVKIIFVLRELIIIQLTIQIHLINCLLNNKI